MKPAFLLFLIFAVLSSHRGLAAPSCLAPKTDAHGPIEQYALGHAYITARCGLAYDEQKAIVWLTKAAEGQHLQAQYELAEIYSTSEKNYPLAKKWYERAALAGHALSALKLGIIQSTFDSKRSNLLNLVSAEKWLRKAADANLNDAYLPLAILYESDSSVGNEEKAFYWMKKAADHGNTKAQFLLANFYKTGRGTEKSINLYLKWLGEATKGGYEPAQNVLVDAYITGLEGLTPQPAEAFKWILIIAEKPQASALWLNRAADIFYDGWMHIKPDYARAFQFYTRAANLDDLHARGRLAEMYSLGKGVQRDPAKARYYLPSTPFPFSSISPPLQPD